MLRVGTQYRDTLRRIQPIRAAERLGVGSHAERGNQICYSADSIVECIDPVQFLIRSSLP